MSKKERSTQAKPELHITVGASSIDREPREAIANDIRLLKPALLYADKVTLLSPAATMIQTIAKAQDTDIRGRYRALSSLVSLMPDEYQQEIAPTLAQYNQLRRKTRGKTRDEIILLQQIESHFDEFWNTDLQQGIQATISDADAAPLLALIKDGVVTLEPVLDSQGTLHADQMVQTFVNKLDNLVSESGSLPLFDDTTGKFIDLGVREGLFNPSQHARNLMAEAASASGFMQRLPTFPHADLDELLDIRKDLQAPLIRFRSEMVGMSTEFLNAAYEPEFSSEVEAMYRGRVAPALLELEEQIETTKHLHQFLSAAAQRPEGFIASSLVLVGMYQAGAGAWESLASSAAAAVAGSSIPALWTRKQALSKSKQYPFYFLHQTEKRLRDRRE